MVNHERVEDAFEEAAAAGVRAFVVPGVGAEAGAAAKPTTERLAARARELGAALLGPNCMGVLRPGGPAAWNGQPAGARPRRVTSPCSASRARSPTRSSRSAAAIGLRCVVSSGAEAVTDAADFLAFFADDDETRAVGLFLETVRRPDAFVDALRRAAPRPGSPSSASRSVARRRRRGRRSPTRVRSSAPSARSRRCSGATPRSRSATSTSSSRRSRSSAGAAGPSGRADRARSRSRAASARCSPTRPRLPGSRSSRCSDDARGARCASAFPNYLAPGNPLDAWGIADETEVYPRSLELLAESGAFDVLARAGRPVAVPRSGERRAGAS